MDVPNVRGLTSKEATSKPQAAGFDVKVDEPWFNVITGGRDRVTAQSPSAGSQARPGTRVTITPASSGLVRRGRVSGESAGHVNPRPNVDPDCRVSSRHGDLGHHVRGCGIHHRTAPGVHLPRLAIRDRRLAALFAVRPHPSDPRHA